MIARVLPSYERLTAGPWKHACGALACRACSLPALPRRRVCHRKACSHALIAATRPRHVVGLRDAGICALCLRDCSELDDALRRARSNPAAFDALRKHHGLSAAEALRSTWHADHVVPLCRGGDSSLSNLRTLCWLCHKAETARVLHGLERAA